MTEEGMEEDVKLLEVADPAKQVCLHCRRQAIEYNLVTLEDNRISIKSRGGHVIIT